MQEGEGYYSQKESFDFTRQKIRTAADMPLEDAMAKLARRGKENDSLKQFIVSLSDILND